MKLLTQLRIGPRLAAVLSTMVLLLLAVAGAGAWGIDTMNRMSDRALEGDVKLALEAQHIRTDVLLLRRHEKDLFINADGPARRDEHLQKWRRVDERLQARLQALQESGTAAAGREAMRTMAADLGQYRAALTSVVQKLQAGEALQAAAADQQLTPAKRHIHGLESMAEKLSEDATARARAIAPEIDATQRAAQWTLAICTLVALAFAVAATWLVTRSIVLPLREALQVAERVSAGDLALEMPHSEARDEPAQLLNALGRMTRQLSQLVAQLRDASESIATGSTQIATGNADLSHRTEEQASNLQQTSASMVQLDQAVSATAQHAQAANDLAQQAAQAATQGGSSVADVAAKMGEIRGHSQRIAEIIGVIDAIAFQTNILALNAAVEAARAGEHGRGFAVVASEVRSLAQRSSLAARDIKQLIEHSGASVTGGAALVDEACGSMQRIVDSVHGLRELIGQISHACNEQRGGVGEISGAVSAIDQMTQQNAALVEESAAAAESLRQQAGRMAEMAGGFKLPA